MLIQEQKKAEGKKFPSYIKKYHGVAEKMKRQRKTSILYSIEYRMWCGGCSLGVGGRFRLTIVIYIYSTPYTNHRGPGHRGGLGWESI